VLWQREFRLRTKIPLDTLKVIGSVGEPINEEAGIGTMTMWAINDVP
jgi:acyl-coenzyme A synthetase/AMP-(fatty) acid ligase